MNKDILSLKGLYQFLFVNDYPIFSTGIISKNNRVGLTLTKFWQENILIDFRNLKYGRMIWRTEGGRNRYISEICNRSNRISFYNEYACEWSDIINQEVMLRQINQFAGFLVERSFDYNVFVQKLEAYIKYLSAKDSAFSKGAEEFFTESLNERTCLEEFGIRGQAFFCGWVLSFFMLHAMAGNGEGEGILRQLRRNQEFSVRSLCKLLIKTESPQNKEVKFLTTKNSEICREPLDSRHFFGREEELFELLDMLKVGGKYLISGIGGIGKTELMRQLLHSTIEEGLVDCVCVVQYEGNMADSLIRAFGQTHSGEKEMKVQEALAIVRMHVDERVLMLVDNVSHSVEEDADIELLRKLPATIFMTSRYQTMNGFETYAVKPISKNAGALIFRDNYTLPINNMDKQLLSNLLDKDIWCHTLTLRLLGKAAKAKKWTLQEMLAQLDENGKELTLGRQTGYESLKQLYRQIYAVSGLEDYMNRFLQIFAVLPYGSYDMKFIRTYLRDFLREGADIERSVEQLWESGWLEKRESGYSMHPFVSECVLIKELSVEEVLPFFDRVIEMLEGTTDDFFVDILQRMRCMGSAYEIPKSVEMLLLLIGKVALQLTGMPQERYFQLILLGYQVETATVGVSKSMVEHIEKMWKQVEMYSEITYVGALIVWQGGCSNPEQLEPEYDKVIRMNIPEKLKDLYKAVLGECLCFLPPNKSDFREKVGMDNWNVENSILVRISGANLLSIVYVEKGDIEKAVTILQEGVELGKDIIYENYQEWTTLKASLASIYSSLGKYDEAEFLIKELSEFGEGGIYTKYLVLQLKAIWKREKGVDGFGIEEFEEAVKMAEVLFVDYHMINYFHVVSDLAMAYHKAKKYEEAEISYQKAIAVMDEFECDEFSKHRLMNNLGVLYLDMEKYEEAFEYFTKAYEMGKEMGGLPLAEPANNLSKLCGKLGDREKELQYIEEALPILEHFYGSEHPKVLDAKKRKEKGGC